MPRDLRAGARQILFQGRAKQGRAVPGGRCVHAHRVAAICGGRALRRIFGEHSGLAGELRHRAHTRDSGYDIMLEALKTVGLAAALDNLIVVQAALTAMNGSGYADWMGATSAVVIAPAMILGLYMVVRMARVRNGGYARSMLREAEKIAGKCGSGVRILGFDDDFVLPLRLLYESDGAELCGRRLRVETECLGRIKRL